MRCGSVATITALTLLVGVGASAQPPRDTENASRVEIPGKGEALRSEYVIGARVRTAEGKDLGKVEYLGYSESVELIKNRQLDATLLSSGLGVAAVRDLATAVKIVVIPIPAEVVTKIGEAAYTTGVIPANTYNGQTADVPTVTVQNFLVTHEGVPADTVYKMTKVMFENLDAMVAAHAAAKAINPKTAGLGSPVPLHPGAEKYYREIGLIK